MKKLSVILPAYRPDPSIFRRTLEHLAAQSIPDDLRELIFVASATPIDELKTHAQGLFRQEPRYVEVPEPGLTRARVAGIQKAEGEVLVFVDDDNFLDENYLAAAVRLLSRYPEVVVAGGKSLPEYEREPRYTGEDINRLLALRDKGDEPIVSSFLGKIQSYPEFSPIGAGMIIRKEAAQGYVEYVSSSVEIPDRMGKRLTSGGDNDMVLYCLKNHGEIGYFPELVLYHFIPQVRVSPQYLARMNFESSCSWVKVLRKHDICPWKLLTAFQVWLRCGVAFFRAHAWCGGERYIHWRGICGHYQGRLQS